VNVGGLSESVLDAASDLADARAELEGTAPRSYGLGRRCAYCDARLNQYVAPHPCGADLCLRHRDGGILPGDEYPSLPWGGVTPDTKRARSNAAKRALAAARRAQARLLAGLDASAALDVAWAAMEDALYEGAACPGAAQLWISSLHHLEALVVDTPTPIIHVQLDLGLAA
jgi:hypothetical protein